jgi:hypothetical protein
VRQKEAFHKKSLLYYYSTPGENSRLGVHLQRRSIVDTSLRMSYIIECNQCILDRTAGQASVLYCSTRPKKKPNLIFATFKSLRHTCTHGPLKLALEVHDVCTKICSTNFTEISRHLFAFVGNADAEGFGTGFFLFPLSQAPRFGYITFSQTQDLKENH